MEKQTQPRVIVLVGGSGAMGALFARHFTASGYEVRILEKADWPHAAKIVKGAHALIVSVPICSTIEVIQALPELEPTCLLADFTSLKEKPLKAMLKKHQGPVIGLHPMFGPGVASVNKHKLVYCQGRHSARCAWLLREFANWGLELVAARPTEHDKNMALIQGLRHFMHFALGAYLCKEKYDLSLLLNMASPSFHIDMLQVGRLFNNSGQLCADIVAGDKSLALIKDFQQQAASLWDMFAQPDKTKIMEFFALINNWLGADGDQLNQQSNLLENFLYQ